MNLGNYAQSSVTVTRPVASHSQGTVETVGYDYSDLGLPFYYYLFPDFSALIYLIQFLVLVSLVSVAVTTIGGFIIFIVWKKVKRKYNCPVCGEVYEYTPWGKIRKCKKCGTSLVAKRCP